MPAVAPAEQHTHHLSGLPRRHPPPRLAAWPARLRAPLQDAPAQWSKPPGLPCRRSRRQSNTNPNATGVPAPPGPQDCALHFKMPPPVEQAARLAMPAVVPAEQHTHHLSGLPRRHPPPRLAAWPARLRAPLQDAAACGACRQACHAGGRAGGRRLNLFHPQLCIPAQELLCGERIPGCLSARRELGQRTAPLMSPAGRRGPKRYGCFGKTGLQTGHGANPRFRVWRSTQR